MKILAIDDEPSARFLLEASLKKWGYQPIMAESCEEALSIYSQGGIGFVISDWVMPGEVQGIDLVNLIRASNAQKKDDYTYIILLTSKSEQQDVFEGIKAGADDYVKKPFDPRELRTRIQLGRRIMTLRETNLAITGQLEEMKHALDYDELTKTLRRSAFMRKLEQDLKMCRDAKKPLSLMMVSANNLLTISHTYGFRIGEKVLQEFVGRLKVVCTQGEITGRFSDTDFVLYAPNSDEKDMLLLSNFVKNDIEHVPFKLDNNLALNVQALIGISYSRAHNPQDAETLVTQALYQILSVNLKESTFNV